MTAEQLLCKISKILQDLKIPYAVTGGFAVAVWGKPRFTADIDIIIELTGENIPLLAKTLLAVDKDVYVSEEAMQDGLKYKGEFNFIHPQTGLKVDFWVKADDFYNKLKLQRAIPKLVNKQKTFFVSPEDLILAKLLWYKKSESTRHLEDIKSILQISKVNLNYIKKWAAQHSTLKIFERITQHL